MGTPVNGRGNTGRLALGAMALALTLAVVTACEDMTPDYRANHPIVVDKRSFSLSLHLPSPGVPLSRFDEQRLAVFADNFLTRGDGQVEIVLPEGKGSSERAFDVSARLEALGLRASEIAVHTVPAAKADGKEPGADDGRVLLNYRAYVAQVPQCGDWSESSSFNPGNGPLDSFGCSVQRNIGLMVRNPRDLLRSRQAEARDGARSSSVVGAYQQGKIVENPAKVNAAVSEVAADK
ncbi:MAG: CpaD family pilus assembly protein [Alphaproteobacteria bacterium]|nr:CpaD family pilus assembly protein [Alphaproteobacteria bacterium]